MECGKGSRKSTLLARVSGICRKILLLVAVMDWEGAIAAGQLWACPAAELCPLPGITPLRLFLEAPQGTGRHVSGGRHGARGGHLEGADGVRACSLWPFAVVQVSTGCLRPRTHHKRGKGEPCARRR